MDLRLTLGIAGVFILLGKGWLCLVLFVWLLTRGRQGVTVAVIADVIRVGWSDGGW